MKKHGGREHRVREIAYLLWERDGYPDGESERHWFEAELLYDAEDAERKAAEGEPPGGSAEKTLASAPPKAEAPASGKGSEAAAEAAPPAKPAAATPAAKTKVAAKRADTSAESSSAKAPAAPKRKA
jgi:hypothetical protein